MLGSSPRLRHMGLPSIFVGLAVPVATVVSWVLSLAPTAARWMTSSGSPYRHLQIMKLSTLHHLPCSQNCMTISRRRKNVRFYIHMMHCSTYYKLRNDVRTRYLSSPSVAQRRLQKSIKSAIMFAWRLLGNEGT